MEIVKFLTAWLDEDETLARKTQRQVSDLLNGSDPAAVGHWFVTRRPSSAIFVAAKDQWDRETEIVPTYGGGYADHIARHDPARVLREVAAKRRRLDRHRPETTEYYDRHGQLATFTACEICGNGGTTNNAWPCVELLDDAAPYAGAPGFDESWARD